MLNNISNLSSQFSALQALLKNHVANTPSAHNAPPSGPPASSIIINGQNLGTLLPSALQSLSNSSSIGAAVNNTAQNILKKPPFKPTDVNMFSPTIYPAGKATAPAPIKAVTETEMKGQLTKIFNTRFNGNSAQVKSAVALMDDPALKKVAPDPKLRASIVNLKGTSGEPAIDAYKRGDFGSVGWGAIPGNGIGQSVTVQGQSKPNIQVNEKYKGEDLRLLSSTMAHETLHTDTPDSQTEELINGSMDIMVYGKMALEDPSLARSGTELARRQNTQLMARLNTRDANGNLSIYQGNSNNVYPGGSKALPSFGAAFGITNPSQATSTPGNATLKAMLQKTTGQTVNNPNFDANTLTLLDKNQKVLTPAELVALAGVLKLDIR